MIGHQRFLFFQPHDQLISQTATSRQKPQIPCSPDALLPNCLCLSLAGQEDVVIAIAVSSRGIQLNDTAQ
ncbi:MAG: hypothetical protein CBE00_10905 [Planctomycetaceae bacterium TMED240]|nr:hypothetical protein [Rhodopirellula sp.]OUX05275.1 MAG: hypothetical protein CBE00_10905 [Planctomycetaceae bacterium TMED240]